jgi:hypothetical protein
LKLVASGSSAGSSVVSQIPYSVKLVASGIYGAAVDYAKNIGSGYNVDPLTNNVYEILNVFGRPVTSGAVIENFWGQKDNDDPSHNLGAYVQGAPSSLSFSQGYVFDINGYGKDADGCIVIHPSGNHDYVGNQSFTVFVGNSGYAITLPNVITHENIWASGRMTANITHVGR